MKKALITGITGQDGSYLAELLLSKNYEVFGIDRRVAVEDSENRYSRVNHLIDKVKLYSGDVRDYARLFSIIEEVKPDELYHLAAQSFVGTSFKDEYTIIETNVKGTVNILNILRKVKSDCRFYFAASSEMFGEVLETPQTEKTSFNPRSPYGISKCSSFYYTRLYREAYNMHCSNGILFNHESPRRGLEFVTRKITSAVAKIKLNKVQELRLGYIEAKRDWGYAGDYVEAMWLMLQQDNSDDYVIATGKTHSIKEFLEAAFKPVGLDWQKYVIIDQKFYRPADVNLLVGDYSKAKRILNWQPKVSFEELVYKMLQHDIKLLEK